MVGEEINKRGRLISAVNQRYKSKYTEDEWKPYSLLEQKTHRWIIHNNNSNPKLHSCTFEWDIHQIHILKPDRTSVHTVKSHCSLISLWGRRKRNTKECTLEKSHSLPCSKTTQPTGSHNEQMLTVWREEINNWRSYLWCMWLLPKQTYIVLVHVA